MNMHFPQLELLVNQNKGHLYNYGKDGVIVTDSSSREMIHLPLNEENNIDPKEIDHVKQFFSDLELRQTSQTPSVLKPIIWLDVEASVLADSKQKTNCVKSLQKMAEQHSCTLRIHFDKAPISWQDLLLPLIEQLQDENTKDTVRLQLHGTFAPMEESVMEFLFNNRIQLFYVLDTDNLNSYKEIISGLSEYGFRVPCVWYVDNDNINLIPSLIDEAMEWNYDAGFALPLAAERPVGHGKTNPSSADYLRLMLDVYKNYSCYDEIFYPMNMALLESIGDTNNTASKIWRWSHDHSSFCEYFHEMNAEKIHKILRRSFIWQRHIVKDRLNSFFANQEPMNGSVKL